MCWAASTLRRSRTSISGGAVGTATPFVTDVSCFPRAWNAHSHSCAESALTSAKSSTMSSTSAVARLTVAPGYASPESAATTAAFPPAA